MITCFIPIITISEFYECYFIDIGKVLEQIGSQDLKWNDCVIV